MRDSRERSGRASAAAERLRRSSSATSQSARERARRRGASSSRVSAMSPISSTFAPRASAWLVRPRCSSGVVMGHGRDCSSTASTPTVTTRSARSSRDRPTALPTRPNARGWGSGSTPLPLRVVSVGAGSVSMNGLSHPPASPVRHSRPTTSTGRAALTNSRAASSSAADDGGATAGRSEVRTGSAASVAASRATRTTTGPRGSRIASCTA